MNIPATPPVRNARVMAERSPDSRAALATRTLPRTASHMPENPVVAEKTAPTTKATERPNRIMNSECTWPPGTGRMKKIAMASTATNAATVRSWRFR